MEYKQIRIEAKEAEEIAARLYNINGKAHPLPGEIDFNFRIEPEKGDSCILKISRPGEEEAYLHFQQNLLHYLKHASTSVRAPRAIPDTAGKLVSFTKDEAGNSRAVRMLSWIPGRLWSDVNPHSENLRKSLGRQCGLLTSSLMGFEDEWSKRFFEWDIAQGLWTMKHLHHFKKEENEILKYFQDLFAENKDEFDRLRKSVIHNDVNDNNVVVSQDYLEPEVEAIIDFGDAVYTQCINDLAAVCAYAAMHHPDPLDSILPIVAAYHKIFPFEEQELSHLYVCMAMRLVISVTKSAINRKEEPDNIYLLVSENAAWQLLRKWYGINKEFAHFSFRAVCGFEPHPAYKRFHEYFEDKKYSLKELFPGIGLEETYPLDLSVSSKWLGHEREFNDLEYFSYKLLRLQQSHPDKILAGGYLESRPLYTSGEYDRMGNFGRESRSVHLGVDFWLPAGTAVHALFAGEVVMAVNNEGEKEYGGMIILRHSEGGQEFFSLYGHMEVAGILEKKPGSRIEKGEQLGLLGNFPENGNWVPHLHFQLMLSLLGYSTDFPGVAYPRERKVWEGICPDPNILFKSSGLSATQSISDSQLLGFRQTHLGKSLSLQYRKPIHIVRGSGQYLLDQDGRKYLDTVNNVAHVGHENFEVIKAGREQMALLNTNTRYLHQEINALATELLATLPPELSVLHFVNSGSEANELAMRMVRACTGERDMVASEVGYHGNTNMCIEISSYKFDGRGGSGAPEFTHIHPLPDTFRGKYRGVKAGVEYAWEVKRQVEAIHNKGRGVAGFIIEPIISCGGQIELPDGFLKEAYKFIRDAGGLCISDEVQVGCGRLGKAFWGFQLYGVVPDIVTIGKPIGNGHPLAAVACTPAVAEGFANGMEYFNTFGGNPVSCAIGRTVLQLVREQGLQENALRVGEQLKSQLRDLAREFPIIADVRGQGLFLGFELTDADMKPLANQANYLANRMKELGILMSTDGPDNNVMKIKPPMVFTSDNAAELIHYLRKVLAEDYMRA